MDRNGANGALPETNATQNGATPYVRPIKPCRHCGTQVAKRARGLCWRCYKDKSIQCRYGLTAQYDATKSCADNLHPTKLPKPTSAIPGTEEKVAVLEQRAADNELLWHPDDASFLGYSRYRRTKVYRTPTMRNGKHNFRLRI